MDCALHFSNGACDEIGAEAAALDIGATPVKNALTTFMNTIGTAVTTAVGR